MAPHGSVATVVCQRMYHIPVCIICVAVMAVQAFIINHYLILKYSSLWNAWYAADAVSVAFFIWAFVDSYLHMRSRLQDDRPRRHLFKGKLGHMPLIYISWCVYSILLAARVAIIFRWIAPFLEDQMYGPNTLKTGVSLSSIIFLLLVIAHIDAEPNSIREHYITGIISKVTIDVLDCVQLLELLFLTENNFLLTYEMHKSVIGIGCINLMLPAIKLVILSGWDFGNKKMGNLFETVHLVLYLLAVNLPMLVIRCLLWSVHKQDISVFIIKNALSLCMTIKAIRDHCITFNTDFSNPKVNANADESDHQPHEEIELQPK